MLQRQSGQAREIYQGSLQIAEEQHKAFCHEHEYSPTPHNLPLPPTAEHTSVLTPHLFTSVFKVAVEPPQGLKNILLWTFGYSGSGEVTEEIFENPDNGQWWKKLLFTLCFFNAVVNERKNYGTLGWNIAYKFISSDLEVSLNSPKQTIACV